MADPLCIGVDVGGTNTDVVILKGNEIVAKGKLATTEDVTSSVASCIESVINQLAKKTGQTVPKIKSLISRVNIGTTHFINAVIQRKSLDKVSLIRLCGPSSRALPPFCDFPSDLRDTVHGGYHFVNGGFQFNGKEITSLNEDEIISAVDDIKKAGIKNIVVSGIFSPSNPSQEKQVKAIILEHYPDASISLSHEIGQNGILERENAAVLNESLKSLSKKIINGFDSQLQKIGIKSPFYLTQNDGTLIKAADVLQFPVFTFSSGATNSLRGASFLSGLKDAIVIDIGGTSSDVGVLRKGFPKEASTRVKVGGVNTNFRMPDVLCIGLGGGSIVTQGTKVDISKQSVERRLEKEAIVFGGQTLTTTDIAVAAGLANIGDPKKVSNLDDNLCKNVLKLIKSKLEYLIDQVKLSGNSCPVVIVGGGSILIKDDISLAGVSKLIKPCHSEVANAVGAALSQISGTFDGFVDISEITIEEALANAKKCATEIVIKNGAIPDTVEIIDVVDTNINYIAIPTRRIKVKAVGDLEVYNYMTEDIQLPENTMKIAADEETSIRSSVKHIEKMQSNSKLIDEEAHLESFTSTASKADAIRQPHIDKETGEWILNERDVDCICIGAGIMGCGGGGSTYIGRLRLKKLLKDGKKLRIIDPLSLKGQSDLILMVAFMGAPAISIEKLIGGNEIDTASLAVMKMHALGLDKKNAIQSNEIREKYAIKREGNVEVIGNMAEVLQTQIPNESEHRMAALMSGEIGGMNAVESIITASQSGLPVVDCDGMGRAFPKLEHLIPVINGGSPTPAAISDEKGEVVAVVNVDSAKDMEDFFRQHTIRMGCTSGLAIAFTVNEVISKCPLYTLSRAWRIGNAVISARQDHIDPVKAIVECENAAIIITGKVVEVHRGTKGGFDYGYSIIEGFAKYSGKKMKIEFQNENLIVLDMLSDEIIVTVPDLISIVDSDTGEPIPTEENRYGLRVSVIILPAMPIMCSEKTLNAFGPETFGYDNVSYAPFVDFKDINPVTNVV